MNEEQEKQAEKVHRRATRKDVLRVDQKGMYVNNEPVVDVRIIPMKFKGAGVMCWLVLNSRRQVDIDFKSLLEALYAFEKTAFDHGLEQKNVIILGKG